MKISNLKTISNLKVSNSICIKNQRYTELVGCCFAVDKFKCDDFCWLSPAKLCALHLCPVMSCSIICVLHSVSQWYIIIITDDDILCVESIGYPISNPSLRAAPDAEKMSHASSAINGGYKLASIRYTNLT